MHVSIEDMCITGERMNCKSRLQTTVVQSSSFFPSLCVFCVNFYHMFQSSTPASVITYYLYLAKRVSSLALCIRDYVLFRVHKLIML